MVQKMMRQVALYVVGILILAAPNYGSASPATTAERKDDRIALFVLGERDNATQKSLWSIEIALSEAGWAKVAGERVSVERLAEVVRTTTGSRVAFPRKSGSTSLIFDLADPASRSD